MALLSALLEFGAGALLIWPKTRSVGIAVIVVLHLTLLLLIGPIGLNYAPVVWPWNVAMASWVVALFWKWTERDAFKIRDPVHAVVLILFGLLPALNLVGLWDAYLSFHAFSGAQMDAYLEVPPGLETELPEPARRVLHDHRVYFASWSFADNGASAYPAERVYHRVFKTMCKTAPDIILVIVSKPQWPSGRTTEISETCVTNTD
jgi:hypothetical protein